MAVELAVLPADAALFEERFQACPQRLGRHALAAYAGRQMAAARKHPEVAFELRQELNVDVLLLLRQVVAQRVHGVARTPLGADVAQPVARASGNDAEVSLDGPLVGLQQPAVVPGDRLEDARLLDAGAGTLGPLQQHAVQIETRVDDQRMAQPQARPADPGGGQPCLADQPLRPVVLDQEGIAAVGLVGQAAAAGLLPGQLLVEEDGVQTRLRDPLGGKRAGRTSSQHDDALHFLVPVSPGFGPGAAPIGGWPEGMPPPMPEPCGAPAASALPFTAQRSPFRSSV